METLIILFTILVGIEATSLLYNVVITIYNIQKDKTIAEAQKSVNILSQRNDDLRNSYEESLKEKNKYIEMLSFKIAELENQLNNTNNGNTIHNSNARSNP